MMGKEGYIFFLILWEYFWCVLCVFVLFCFKVVEIFCSFFVLRNWCWLIEVGWRDGWIDGWWVVVWLWVVCFFV